jgi:hypothetical protein
MARKVTLTQSDGSFVGYIARELDGGQNYVTTPDSDAALVVSFVLSQDDGVFEMNNVSRTRMGPLRRLSYLASYQRLCIRAARRLTLMSAQSWDLSWMATETLGLAPPITLF